MSILKKLVFILAALVAVNMSQAQEKIVLTLESSIETALDKNPQLKMAEKELQKAQASVWEAYSNIMPQLNASASWQHAWDIQTNTIPNFIKLMLPPEIGTVIPGFANMPDYVSISFGLENTFVYGATLSQPIFLGGAGVAGIQIANSAKRAAAQSLKAERQNLIYQTSNAFYACLLTRELVNVQEEALAQTEENFQIVSKKYSVGSASGFDKMRAEVEVANLKPQVITARNNFKSALTQLRTILGMPKDADIDVQGEFIYTKDDFASQGLDQVQKLAQSNRPEMIAMGEQKNISRKGVAIARSNFMPKVFFQTDYSYMAMQNDMKLAQNNFSKGLTSALSLQIPLFTGFRNNKQYQKAKLDYKIMVDTEKQVNDGVNAEVEVAYNKFKEADEKYNAAIQSVELAQEALRLANMMYEEGTNTQLDVLNSQLALKQSRLNYVSSVYEYQMARYQLRKVTGSLEGILN